jgi:uncharacterized protein YijF (DUF1287 family)
MRPIFFRVLLIIWVGIFCHSASADRTNELVTAALQSTQEKIIYNGAYFRIDYPNGDIPAKYGVCTDVIIRSYRKLDIDLQRLIHEDMRDNFALYPAKRIWNQTRTDRNIDHRRVPNMQTYFSRHGQSLPVTRRGKDYQPGDLVTWMLSGNLPHVGVVVNRYSDDGERPLIVHNIGAGPQLEDVLFSYPITGRYRYGLATPH